MDFILVLQLFRSSKISSNTDPYSRQKNPVQAWKKNPVHQKDSKKDSNCHKYATFEASFLMFSWAKNQVFFKYPSVRNEKLHNMKL